MNIEVATDVDAEEMLALQKEAFTHEAKRYNDFTIYPLVETIEQYRKNFDTNTIFIMKDHGVIVGSIMVSEKKDSAYLGRLCVKRERWGEGIGSSLMNEAEKRFNHLTRYELFTGHLSTRNISIYQHKGYREFKRTIIDRVEMVCMEKIKL